MAEVVDSIIAKLEIQGIDRYVRDFNAASDAHERFAKSRPDKVGQFSPAEVEQYANRHKKAANDIAVGEEQATQRVTRARKQRSDANRAADELDAGSAERSARRQREAIKSVKDYVDRYIKGEGRGDSAADKAFQQYAANNAAEIEREFQRRTSAGQSQADRNSARRTYGNIGAVPQADRSTSPLGRSVPRQSTGQSSIPAAAIEGEAAAETAVNHVLADQITLRSNLAAATGRERHEIQDKLASMRLENDLRKAGIAEEEIALRLSERQALVERSRAAQAGAGKKGGFGSANEFALQASGGRFGYSFSGGALAGVGVAAGVYGGIEATRSGIDFAKQIADTAQQTGVSTRQIQVYQAAARQAGATNEQLASSFGRLNDQLGRAKEGDQQAAKTFSALNISLKDVKSAGDVLPTVIDRLSQIKDPAERAAVGSRLFGDEYRRLDAVLGQGTGKIDALAASLEKTGSILSGRDIATLKEADAVLGELKARLEVDLARVVAGNAQAILGLANAFANLADKALKAVNAIGRIKAQNAITSGGGTDADRQTLIADGQGRQFLLNRNSAALRANREQSAAVRGSTALMNVDGRAVTGAQFYADQRRKLLADRREVLTYRDPGDITAAVTPGKTGNIGNLFAPKGGSGPKNKTADQLEAEQAERNRQYLDRLSGLQEANLRAQEQLTGDITKQAGIESDIADRALQKQLDDIRLTKERNIARINAEHANASDKAAAVALENSHAAELTAAAKAADAANTRVRAQDLTTRLIEVQNQHLQTQLTIEGEAANIAGQLATTRKERLAAELRLLDVQRRQETAALTAQRDALKPGDPARADIDARLKALPGQFAGREAAVRQGNDSPLGQYRRQLQGAVGDADAVRDSLEGVAVRGFGRLEDQMSSTIGKVLGLKGAFGELASSIVADLSRIAIEKAILAAVGGGSGTGGFLSSLFGGGSSSAGAGVNNLGSFGSDIGSLTGFATGGSATIGGNPGIDQNVLSINGRPSLRVGRGEQLTVTPANQIVANNSRVAAPQAAGGQITVHVEANDYFDARVAHVSGPIAQNTSVRVVKAAAPSIVGAAVGQAPGAVRQEQTLKG